jgi:hypothetical protein
MLLPGCNRAGRHLNTLHFTLHYATLHTTLHTHHSYVSSCLAVTEPGGSVAGSTTAVLEPVNGAQEEENRWNEERICEEAGVVYVYVCEREKECV